ncbi:MAG: hypothetical protein KKD25_01535 [Gammaproteobacteria bacterium]|jgi:uncharacterized integral membrane protein|nr:hypothetical protein [Gammaproteobacteria bacterium]MBU0771053.1 hypothetical protein [Gammaproteobacteria bacterium]MBU0854634.1 hypothetical protein [Gammaproteobacteria bacterium]MBU1845966.1 hypothetical protein [Gammaproteobacteria bacterium]
MKLIGALGILVLGLLSAFVIANWQVLVMPVSVSLLVASIDAPAGIILLGGTALLLVLLGAYTLTLHTSTLFEARRHAKEMREQRLLADQAEASRFTELNASMQKEFADLREAIKQFAGESTNSLAAVIGEVEDKLDRALGERH